MKVGILARTDMSGVFKGCQVRCKAVCHSKMLAASGGDWGSTGVPSPPRTDGPLVHINIRLGVVGMPVK